MVTKLFGENHFNTTTQSSDDFLMKRYFYVFIH